MLQQKTLAFDNGCAKQPKLMKTLFYQRIREEKQEQRR